MTTDRSDDTPPVEGTAAQPVDDTQGEDTPAWSGALVGVGGGEQQVVEPDVPPERLRSVVESLLLVADRPLSPTYLATFLSVQPDDVRVVFQQWRDELEAREAGVRLVEVGGGYRLRTATENAPWVHQMTGRRPAKLSRAALEALSIVAYRQPATRTEIEDVRGVDSSVVLRSLLEKDLLRIVGRQEEPGRPMLYGTTRKFLEVFGLRSLADLPSLREFAGLAVGEQEDLFGERPLDAPPADQEEAQEE